MGLFSIKITVRLCNEGVKLLLQIVHKFITPLGGDITWFVWTFHVEPSFRELVREGESVAVSRCFT